MILLDELRVTMTDYRKDLKELYEVLGIEKAQARYDELQKQVAEPGFWDDLDNSQKVLQESKSLENRINKYRKMEETLDDILGFAIAAGALTASRPGTIRAMPQREEVRRSLQDLQN